MIPSFLARSLLRQTCQLQLCTDRNAHAPAQRLQLEAARRQALQVHIPDDAAAVAVADVPPARNKQTFGRHSSHRLSDDMQPR